MTEPAQPGPARRLVLAGGAATLAAPFIARPARAAPTSWVLYTSRQRTSPALPVLEEMAAAIKTASSGALEITVVTAGRMPVDANAITPAVTAGALTMGEDSFYAQTIVPGGVPRLPMLVPDRAAFRRGTTAIRKFLNAAYDARNAVLLAYTFTPKLRTWSSFKFDSYAGLNNRRVRATSPEQGEFIRRLGAIPVTIPTADVARAIGAGEVEALFSFATTGGTAWHKLLKSGYENGPHHYDAVLIANKSAFRTLPAPLQTIVADAAAKAELRIMDALFDHEDKALRKLADDGLELQEQQNEDVNAVTSRLSAMWDEWTRVRGRESQDLLYAFKRAMEAS